MQDPARPVLILTIGISDSADAKALKMIADVRWLPLYREDAERYPLGFRPTRSLPRGGGRKIV